MLLLFASCSSYLLKMREFEIRDSRCLFLLHVFLSSPSIACYISFSFFSFFHSVIYLSLSFSSHLYNFYTSIFSAIFLLFLQRKNISIYMGGKIHLQLGWDECSTFRLWQQQQLMFFQYQENDTFLHIFNPFKMAKKYSKHLFMYTVDLTI